MSPVPNPTATLNDFTPGDRVTTTNYGERIVIGESHQYPGSLVLETTARGHLAQRSRRFVTLKPGSLTPVVPTVTLTVELPAKDAESLATATGPLGSWLSALQDAARKAVA